MAKYILAAIFLVMGTISLLRGRHGYGGWSGDFFDEEKEIVLTGWQAIVLNLATIAIGLSALFGLGWFLLAVGCFLVVRKVVISIGE